MKLPPKPVFLVLLFLSLSFSIWIFLEKNSDWSGSNSISYKAPPRSMVLVDKGDFFMGSNDAFSESDEKPFRKIFLGAFYIDQFEVTNIQYKKFMPGHQFPSDQENLPKTGILRWEAQAYCESLGKRLPTGAEWEKAARGRDGRIYPWGNALEPEKANFRLNHSTSTTLLPVGSYPRGVSPYGCYDMSGNAWEWVSDNFESGSFFEFGGQPISRGIVRGGAYRYSAHQARTSYQGFEDPNLTCNDIGFRCAMDTKN